MKHHTIIFRGRNLNCIPFLFHFVKPFVNNKNWYFFSFKFLYYCLSYIELRECETMTVRKTFENDSLSEIVLLHL